MKSISDKDNSLKESFRHNNVTNLPGKVLKGSEMKIKHSYGAGALTPEAAKELGPKAEKLRKEKLKKIELPNIKNNKKPIVEKILEEMIGDIPGCNIKKSKTLEKISKKHKVPLEQVQSQLEKGIAVEMEHTTDKGEARIIALQHLEELPNYYDKLKKVEVKEAKKYMTKDEDPCWKGYKMVGSKKKGGKKVPNCVPVEESITRIPSQNGRILDVLISWKGKLITSKLFFPQLNIPKRLEVVQAVQKIYPNCRFISYLPGDLDDNNPLIQVREDWQKVNRNDNTDGMSDSAVKAYRRENPGSKLKTAVTETNPTGERKNRRKNYCDRSKGQKNMHNIDCSKTPDKPICKARSRWNCKN